MSIERVVAETAAGPLLAGLEWRPPATGKHSKRALFDARSQTDASHYVLFEYQQEVRYGLYKEGLADDNKRLPKGAMSAAACFAHLVGQQSPSAALVLPVVDGSDELGEQQFLVVVLEDGVPHIDAVVNEMAVRDTIGSEERAIWAASDIKYPNCEIVDFDWLSKGGAKGGSRAAKLQPIPVNPWPVILAAGAASLALLVWWGMQVKHKADEARRLAQAAAENDPVPKYLAALTMQVGNMGTRREDVVGALSEIFSDKVTLPGWKLSSIECVAIRQQCTLSWQRRGGTFQDIKATLPDQKLVTVTSQGNEVPVLDVATTVRAWPVQRESLLMGPKGPTPLPTFERALSDMGPLMQEWRTAGLRVEIKESMLWPAVEGVPIQFKHPAAVRRGQIQIEGVPGAFIQEVLEAVPRWIQWESIRVDVTDGEARSLLNFKATGNYYVSSP